MALTDQEKHDVLFYLGWPGKSLQQSSQIFNSVVSDRLQNLPTPVELRTRKVIKLLKNNDDRLSCAEDRLAASAVDDIKMNEREIELLRKERRSKVRELSDLLNIVVRRSDSNRTFGVSV